MKEERDVVDKVRRQLEERVKYYQAAYEKKGYSSDRYRAMGLQEALQMLCDLKV